MSPIIFLDIDGVLNSDAFLREAATKDGGRIVLASGYYSETSDWDPRTHIDPARVARLNQILARTGAKVVVSSSWRTDFSLNELSGFLGHHGFVGELVDVTPQLFNRERFVEIKRWLSNQANPPRFVILDDDRDAGYGFEQFVHVTDGLEDEHVERAVAILGGTP